MEIFNSALPQFAPIVNIAYDFFLHGLPFKYGWIFSGWIYFILGIVYLLWKAYILEIQHQFVHGNNFVFYKIRVPKDNLVSTLAVETIFSQLHALQVNKTFAEKYVEGHIQLYYSLEIVSLGGQISFIIRVPDKIKTNFEAAIYAHDPQAEIQEVSDYLENVQYDPLDPNCPIEIFGTEWKLVSDDVIPLKTYKDFEHPTAEESIIDPLQNFFEGMAKVRSHEVFAVQIIIQPQASALWVPRADKKIKELIGEEPEHAHGFWSFLTSPFDKFSKLKYSELFSGGHAHAPEPVVGKPKNNWMQLTEGEKEKVTLIEQKKSKPGYLTKIRFLFIAPKEKYNRDSVFAIVGSWRPFSSTMANELKPDVSLTWTGIDHVFSPKLEKPYLDWLLAYKRKWLWKGFKNRDVHIGGAMFYLNSEEIASLYHFPITTKTTSVQSSIYKTESKKSQPPVNLPVIE